MVSYFWHGLDETEPARVDATLGGVTGTFAYLADNQATVAIFVAKEGVRVFYLALGRLAPGVTEAEVRPAYDEILGRLRDADLPPAT